jgi:Zn finger protein HypA/HybF involved in hydrogenase expression
MNCKFRCMQCKHYFENEKTGQTRCPKCDSQYVEWLNYIEVLKFLGRWNTYGRDQ